MTETIETHPVTKACDPCYSGGHENCLEGPCRCYHRGPDVEPAERAYPVHEKLHEEVHIGWAIGREADVPRGALSQALGDFLAWLSSEGYVLGKWGCPHGEVPYDDCEERYCRDRSNDEKLWPTHDRKEKLLGGFLDIDPQKLAEEKSAMLDAIHEDRA